MYTTFHIAEEVNEHPSECHVQPWAINISFLNMQSLLRAQSAYTGERSGTTCSHTIQALWEMSSAPLRVIQTPLLAPRCKSNRLDRFYATKSLPAPNTIHSYSPKMFLHSCLILNQLRTLFEETQFIDFEGATNRDIKLNNEQSNVCADCKSSAIDSLLIAVSISQPCTYDLTWCQPN